MLLYKGEGFLETSIIIFKPLVTEKFEFDYRYKSIIVVLFGNLGLIHCDGRIKMNGFSTDSSSAVLNFPIETVIEENQPQVTEKREVDFRGESIFIAFGVFWIVRV